jgi:hypothetical protein
MCTLRSKLSYGAVILTFLAATAADAKNANRGLAFLGLPHASVCADSPVLAEWCAKLGVQTAVWIDKGLSLAIDRRFELKDQTIANEIGVTICYKDHRCTHPQ